MCFGGRGAGRLNLIIPPFRFGIGPTCIERMGHGIYIRWYLINRCARKDQSLSFDLYKAFDLFKIRHKSGIFTRKDLFSIMRAQHLMGYHLI